MIPDRLTYNPGYLLEKKSWEKVVPREIPSFLCYVIGPEVASVTKTDTITWKGARTLDVGIMSHVLGKW